MTLSIQHLAFERNNTLLFSEIHCELYQGDILEIRGANGCGKSTLLRMIAGYIRPETGMILWKGNPIFHLLENDTQQLCYLGHQNGVKPLLTVYENLKLACSLFGIKMQRDSLKKIMQTMKLEHVEKTQVMHLSAGQKRRLALSRLLLSQAPLWILDEPTTALDSDGQDLFDDLLKKHVQQGGIAIIATHSDLKINSTIKTLQLSKTRETADV